ncbi:MAG: hypothetical protein ACLUHG_02815 [Sutterella wadsworthensis]
MADAKKAGVTLGGRPEGAEENRQGPPEELDYDVVDRRAVRFSAAIEAKNAGACRS